MLGTLLEMWAQPFIIRAVVVGVLVSLCAALLGVSLVLKRYSMIGDGLSHVGFGSLAIAMAFNLAPLKVSIPIVVAAAFLLLRISESSKIKGDAAIAMISASALAFGVMLVSVTTGLNTDVCNYMFGSLLTLSGGDVTMSIVLASVVLALFLLFYNKIFAVTFDENFAKATGVKTSVYNMIIAFLTAITIVLGMRMMGAMLISALIIFPALTSMRLCKSFRSVTLCSAAVSLCCFFIGANASFIGVPVRQGHSVVLRSLPTGATIVAVNLAAFLAFWLIGVMKGRFADVKKVAAPVIACLLLVTAAGCSAGAPPQVSEAAAAVSEAGEDVTEDVTEDVFEVTEGLYITQTNEIYANKADYLGKVIKIEGMWLREEYGETAYCYVYRNGPGCCGADGFAGFEVRCGGDEPAANDWVEVVGTLEEYDEGGNPYLRLAVSELTVKDERGAESVFR